MNLISAVKAFLNVLQVIFILTHVTTCYECSLWVAFILQIAKPLFDIQAFKLPALLHPIKQEYYS